MFLVALAIAGFVIGALVRRWSALLAVLVVPLYVAGRRLGWWGDGVGDLWQLGALIMTLVAFASIAAGVATGRFLLARVRGWSAPIERANGR